MAIFDDQQLKNCTPAERRQMLEDAADKISNEEYTRALTEDELAAAQEKFINNQIELIKIQERVDEFNKQIAEQKKPFTSESKEVMTQLRTKTITLIGDVYYCADHDNGMMEVYSPEGELLLKRRLKPDERQTAIKPATFAKAN